MSRIRNFMSYNDPKTFGHFAKSQTKSFYDLQKGFTLPSGINEGLSRVEIPLDVQLAYNFDTPLKNAIPRNKVTGGNAISYKVIKENANLKLASFAEDGKRVGFGTTKVQDEAFFFVTFGAEDYVTDNAQLTSLNFNVSSQAMNIVQRQLAETMAVQEEKKIIGGNREKIGEIAEVTATAGTDGSIAAGTVSVIVRPLSYFGLDSSSVNNGVNLTRDRDNADGSTTTIPGGYGLGKSATVTVAANGSVEVFAEDVPDAAGYAFFIGAAGQERLAYVGSINKVKFTSLPTGTQLESVLEDTDQTENKLDYEGLLSWAGKKGQVVSLDGAELVVEGNTIPQLEEVITAITDRGVEPTHIVMDSKTYAAYYKALTKDVQLVAQLGVAGVLTAGGRVGSYVSPNAQNDLIILKDKFLPTGTVKVLTIGYAPNLGLGASIVSVEAQTEYEMEIWARRTRSTEVGMYCTSVLVHRFPESLGVIKNIKV